MLNLLQYSLASLMVFLGLVAGFVLAVSAKEELKPGRKYLIFFQDVILLSIIICLFVFYINIYLVYYIAILLIFFLYFNYKKFNEIVLKKSYMVYSILAIIFYLSSKKIDLFVIESSLMFIYGLPIGSLLTVVKDKRKTIKNILVNVLFIIIALALFLIF